MKQDFHYCCIAVLARAAGFGPRVAGKIAYASQYVDDAYESEPLLVGDRYFDPARTAHYGLLAFDWSVQKRVYIPFHFLPRRPLDGSRDAFLTAPAGRFAELIWKHALASEARTRPYAMGIALHTIADGWAHRGFSGREHEENDVEAIHVLRDGTWEHLFLENITFDLRPKIGHLQAGDCPDEPWLTWKYLRASTGKTVRRNNTAAFLKAAEHIHRLLLDAPNDKRGPVIPWETLEPRIRGRLGDRTRKVAARCAAWAQEFRDLFPQGLSYDEAAWKNDALRPRRQRDVNFKEMAPANYAVLRFPGRRGFYGSPWVQFHRAALRQRHLVLEHLL